MSHVTDTPALTGEFASTGSVGPHRERDTDGFPRWRKAVRDPGEALSVLLALARGQWYKWSLPLRGHRFRAGRYFKVFGRLWLKGPGQVEFGDNVVIRGVVTPWTHHRDARIVIGDGSMMNGSRFACRELITIGRGCLIPVVDIMDTDHHSIRPDRFNPAAPVRTAPVRIGNNVWLGQHAGVLAGTQIGDDSVVSFGAVCMGTFPAGVVIVGNPARAVRPVPPVPPPDGLPAVP
jgi:acetyltransferase-like isoleucine patch superfamily enzyme